MTTWIFTQRDQSHPGVSGQAATTRWRPEMQLIETKRMDQGSLLAVYRPVGPPTYGEFHMEEGLGLPED